MAYKKLKYWFDRELARLLSEKILIESSGFNSKDFIEAIDQGTCNLELKDRVEFIADELFKQFDNNFITCIKHLLQVLGPENQEETGMFTNYYWVMPIAKVVEKYGQNDFGISMEAIEEITKRNTGEYTIRPFIELNP